MPKINLVIGDWSRDGHEKTENVIIKSNLSLVDLQKAYKVGTKEIGFDFIKSVAARYEERELKREYLDKLTEFGYKGSFEYYDYNEESDEEGPNIDEFEYVDILMFICKLGDSSFDYQMIESPEYPRWNIGGYGLFYI